MKGTTVLLALSAVFLLLVLAYFVKKDERDKAVLRKTSEIYKEAYEREFGVGTWKDRPR